MNNYPCPECKSLHATAVEAASCLANCLENELHHACPYCGNVSAIRSDAAYCAARCYMEANALSFARHESAARHIGMEPAKQLAEKAVQA